MSVYIPGMSIPKVGEYHATIYVAENDYAYIDIAEFPVDNDRFRLMPVGSLHDLINYMEAEA